MRATILGCGSVGSLIARISYEEGLFDRLTILDTSKDRVNSIISYFPNQYINSIVADVKDPVVLKHVVEDADVVIGALPGRIGFNVMSKIIEIGKNIVDTSFMKEDPLKLDSKAKESNVTVIPDCGFAPGLTNMIIGNVIDRVGKVDTIKIYVGSIPYKYVPPLGYIVSWSAEDLIEEYVRRPRIIKDGNIVELEPLSGYETLELYDFGYLEAFYTDGLRTMLVTFKNKVKHMFEKTLRYSGHLGKIKFLRSIGLFDEEPLNVSGANIVPKSFLAKLLDKKLRQDVEEIAIALINIIGKSDNKAFNFSFELISKLIKGFNPVSFLTAFVAAMISKALAEGKINREGVVPPELVGSYGILSKILDSLSEKGVIIRSNGLNINF